MIHAYTKLNGHHHRRHARVIVIGNTDSARLRFMAATAWRTPNGPCGGGYMARQAVRVDGRKLSSSVTVTMDEALRATFPSRRVHAARGRLLRCGEAPASRPG